MSEHTPGPWGVTADCFGVYYVNPRIEAGDEETDDPSHDSMVARTNGMGALSGIADAECQANARLIAAAPELLAACEMAENWFREYIGQILDDDPLAGGEVRLHNRIRAAIRKAKGGE